MLVKGPHSRYDLRKSQVSWAIIASGSSRLRLAEATFLGLETTREATRCLGWARFRTGHFNKRCLREEGCIDQQTNREGLSWLKLLDTRLGRTACAFPSTRSRYRLSSDKIKLPMHSTHRAPAAWSSLLKRESPTFSTA